MAELIATEWGDRVDKMLDDFERNPPSPPKGSPPGPGWRPPIRGILLEDLDDEGQADCAVTQKVATTFTQKVSILGDAVRGGTFTLTFSGQTTTAIPWNATADQLKAALVALSNVGANNVTVALGKGAYTNLNTDTPPAKPQTRYPGLWLVTFVGKFLLPGPDGAQAVAPPLMTTSADSIVGGLNMVIEANTFWTDTGVIETMNAVVPVGTPTPTRSGAVAIGMWFPGIGYGVVACECREFSATPGY